MIVHACLVAFSRMLSYIKIFFKELGLKVFRSSDIAAVPRGLAWKI